MNILFICTGNTCRSPMAEAFAKYLGLQASSCGTHAKQGLPASKHARDVLLREYELDISNHSSRPISEELLQEATLIVAMNKDHEEYIAQNFPRYMAKVHPLEVADPYGCDYDTYKACASVIRLIAKSL
ncbi:MAG: low molecular weight protein arginine phosphatase [Defluviitaleaceae bacterium]|nr:low molecular weight protein arginine phosphatase [Defluviitaleaceae bacterium]